MLLPHLTLADFTEDPAVVRSLLSKLSRVSEIGVVEALNLGETSIVRAHADRHNFTIFRTPEGTHVVENLGPRTVRLWQRDPVEDAENALEALHGNFGPYVVQLDPLTYLYTEHSWFIWRPHHATHLPRIKRRAFTSLDSSVVVLHLKQNDVLGGELLEYVLETPTGMWHVSHLSRQNEQGKFDMAVSEPAHPVDKVGF